MEEKLSGNIEIDFQHHDFYLQVKNLCPFIEGDKQLTIDILLEIINDDSVIESCNLKIFEWYLKKTTALGEPIAKITLGHGAMPVCEGSSHIIFKNTDFKHDDITYWHFVKSLFDNLCEYDLYQMLPVTLLYVKKGETIGTLEKIAEDKEGLTLKNEVIPASDLFQQSITTGDNVQYDEENDKFIATIDGYVLFANGVIKVISPFYVTPDYMNLYFINFNRTPHILLKHNDVNDYKLSHNFCENVSNPYFDSNTPIGKPILLASGKPPGEGTDAVLEFFVEVNNKYAEVDENCQINYREVQKFPSVLENDLIVKKIAAVRGENGFDLYGRVIQSRLPVDVNLKNGKGTTREEKEGELLIYASIEGLISYSKNTIAITEKLQIKEDIDYSTGNITTKVNVHIDGSVRTGFTVKSDRNIFVKGIIEEGCTIEAGGDLIINGGSLGQNNNIICHGNMSIKFIQGGQVTVKGSLAVQSFILKAKVICNDSITVAGVGLNLKEKGTIIDSEIYVRNSLICPSIGNEGGLKTFITMGCDIARSAMIKNLSETLKKINDNIENLSKYGCIDPATNSTPLKGDQAKIEVKKLEDQFNMLNGILQKELDIERENIETTSVLITQHMFPPLHMECNNRKRIFNNQHLASRFFYDTKEGTVERVRYFKGNEKPQESVDSE